VTWNVINSWLHKYLCRERPKMWMTDCYMNLCVDRDMNSR